MNLEEMPQKAFTHTYNGIVPCIRTNVSFSSSFKVASSKKIEAIGLWDTGATSSAISSEIAKKCGLIPISKTEVATAGGIVSQNVYLVDIFLPNKVVIQSVRVTEIPCIQGADALIGMDVMSCGDLAITHDSNKTTFTFRIPSSDKIDFVETINKYNQKLIERQRKEKERILKIHGNEKCPCGSGKKYRYCCGNEKIKQKQ